MIRTTGRMALAMAVTSAPYLCLSACGQSGPTRQELVERCSQLVSENRLQEGAACLGGFENDSKPDAQTASAMYQLGQLYDSGRGVPADPDHALRLYRSAEKLSAVAPDTATQAAKSATRLINRMRQAEEP